MKILRKFIGQNLIKSASIADKGTPVRSKLVRVIDHAQNTKSPYRTIYSRFLKSEPDLTDEEFFYAFSHLPILEKDDLIESYERQKRPLNPAEAIFQENKLYPQSITKLLKFAFSHKNYMTLFPAYKTKEDELSLKYTSRKELCHYINGYLDAYKQQGWKIGEPILFVYAHSALVPHFFKNHEDFLKRYFATSFLCINDETKDNIGELVTQELHNNKCQMLITNPATLFYIAQNMSKKATAPHTQTLKINLSGQPLADCTRFFIQKHFPESDIQSSYTTLTCGCIAHQKALNSFEYDVMSNRVHLEQGPDNTILLTSFYPRQFPLIRYKVTDTGRIVTHENGTQSIQPLEGKADNHIVNSKDYLFFTSYFNDVVNRINKSMNDPIRFFSVRHDKKFGKQYLRLHCVVEHEKKNEQIAHMAWEILSHTFANYHYIDIKFKTFSDQVLENNFQVVDRKEGFADEIEAKLIEHAAPSNTDIEEQPQEKAS
ncbi:MAG: hypothetical protein ACRBCK_09205 [Alphaproteobacteria bacterium]